MAAESALPLPPSRSSTNTIASNAATQGGGIYCSSCSPTIVNTIIAFNSSGIYKASGTGAPVLLSNCVYGNSTYNYSGLTDASGSNGNISADPCLADTSYGNMHVQPGSPCIDMGDDGVVQAGWSDMDAQPRQQGVHVDIGADESDVTAWPQGPYMIVRVSPNGNDANDGASWSLAKRNRAGGYRCGCRKGRRGVGRGWYVRGADLVAALLCTSMVVLQVTRCSGPRGTGPATRQSWTAAKAHTW